MLHPAPHSRYYRRGVGPAPVTGIVSVIIPVYLPVRYLAEAIDSALAQRWPHLEIIVVNDGSPESPAIERIVDERAGRPIVYLRQANRGPGAARNAGIRAATGEFLAFLDADDYWDPLFLPSQVAVLVADPDCDLVYCDARMVRDSTARSQTFMDLNPSTGDVSLRSLLLHQCTVLTSTVVARPGAIRAAGGFDETLWRGQDFDLWLRLAQCGSRMCYQRLALAYHREHGESLSGDHAMRHRRVLDVLARPRWQSLPPAERAVIDARLGEHRAGLALACGKQHLAAGRFVETERELRNALAVRNSWKLRLALLMLKTAPRLLRAIARRRA
jgi:GT2 family glycosyltransferase